MKTSLILDDRVFDEAQKEALRSGKSLSEVISQWASLGREAWRRNHGKPAKKFKAVDLGKEKIDLTNRRDWMDKLDDRS